MGLERILKSPESATRGVVVFSIMKLTVLCFKGVFVLLCISQR